MRELLFQSLVCAGVLTNHRLPAISVMDTVMSAIRFLQFLFFGLFLGGYAALAIVVLSLALRHLVTEAVQEWRERKTCSIELR